MDEDGNIIDSPKPIRRRPFSLRRMVGDVRRKLKKEMEVPPTYGPPYLEDMPHIDIGLIDQCDQGEPNAQEIHGVLNEGVNPNCTDPENFGETVSAPAGIDHGGLVPKLCRHSPRHASGCSCEPLRSDSVYPPPPAAAAPPTPLPVPPGPPSPQS